MYVVANKILECQPHSSPGFGGSRCPCIATGELENLRRAFGNNLCSDVHPGLLWVLAISSEGETLWLYLRIEGTFREVCACEIVDLNTREDKLTARGGRQAVNMLRYVL